MSLTCRNYREKWKNPSNYVVIDVFRLFVCDTNILIKYVRMRFLLLLVLFCSWVFISADWWKKYCECILKRCLLVALKAFWCNKLTCSKDLSPASLPNFKMSSRMAFFTSWTVTKKILYYTLTTLSETKQKHNITFTMMFLILTTVIFSPTSYLAITQFRVGSWKALSLGPNRQEVWIRHHNSHQTRLWTEKGSHIVMIWKGQMCRHNRSNSSFTCRLSPWTNIWATGSLRL